MPYLDYAITYAPFVVAPVVLLIILGIILRVVVPTNAVHIVQRSGSTTSYGRGQPAGNTYWRFPSWVPRFGVRVTVLPVSIFDRKLVDYAAYDVDRVPFVIDVVGFFRINDSNMAAERVKDFADLEHQLEPILQGAARTILATSPIDQILGDRAVFSEKFTSEVTKDLAGWGVEPVKSIELMDIRDANGSQVIQQIMAKKKSAIEADSRVAVANNGQRAKQAEIAAVRAVQLSQQEADEVVGQRTAQKDQNIGTAQAMKDQNIGIAQQKADQAIQDEAKATQEKVMAVKNVATVRAAEIERDAKVVAAEQAKQVAIRTAEGQKQALVLAAEAALSQATLGAQGIQAQGEANAKAKQLLQVAEIAGQVELAAKIGENKPYQEYLIKIRQVEANQAIGIEQAHALEKANVRVVATANDAASGLNLVSLGTGIKALIDNITKPEDKEAA